MTRVTAIGIGLAGTCLAWVAVGLDQEFADAVEHRPACVSWRGEEGVEVGDDRGRGLAAAPGAVGIDQAVEHGDIELVVGEPLREQVIGGLSAVAKLHQVEQFAVERRRVAEFGNRIVGAGAIHEVFLGALLAEPTAEVGDIGDQRLVAPCFRRRQQGRERAPREFGLGAALDRLETGGDLGLGGKAGEEGLGKGVDGLDAEAAGRLDDPREQAPRSLATGGIIVFVKRLQFGTKDRVGQAHPARQPVAQPIGHLGGARLGEGQAQDRRGRHSAEQQSQYPRDQDLGLAGARRRRQRGMRPRVGRRALMTLEDGEEFEPTRHG